MSMLVCVDPGQAQDPTAISVIERTAIEAEERQLRRGIEHKRALERLDVIHCERLPLHTTYPAVVDRVCEVFSEAMRADKDEDCWCLLDLTGVGRPVRDMIFPRIPRLIAVTITSGQGATYDKDHAEWHVPKRVLVSVVAIALQNERLCFSEEVPGAAQLRYELEHFKVKISKAGNDTYEAWRDEDHDDLVLATALGVWWASMSPAKWTETDIGAEQRIKRDVIERNRRRLARGEPKRPAFMGGGRFS